MDAYYANRIEAGTELAQALEGIDTHNAVVLGLARGGVVVGYAVAEALHLPLQTLVVRKVGAPCEPELALGAVSETGACWLDRGIIQAVGASPGYVDEEVTRKQKEAQERRAKYTAGPDLQTIRGKRAIVVDDGIATGATALVAVQSARRLGASSVVLAIPLATEEAVKLLKPHVDELIVLATPRHFFAIGPYYRDFDQVSDDEVIRYLRLAERIQVPVLR